MIKLRNILPWIHNRWIDPSDRVIIKHPDYPRGYYRDADTRMLYILFQMVVDFVEIETSSMMDTGLYQTPLQHLYDKAQSLPVIHWFLPAQRSARRGLHHLRWAMKLTECPSQAEHAKQVFLLYKFWVHDRPNRIDPWSLVSEYRSTVDHPTDFISSMTPEYRLALQTASETDDKYDEEDERYLHILMNIRRGLWT